MFVRYCVLFSAMCLVSLQGKAGETETVDDLVRQAIAIHPDLSVLRAGQDAAEGELRQTGFRPNPELSTEAGLKQVDAEGASESGYVFGLSLEQPIERGGKREARQAVARASQQLAELELQAKLIEIEAAVRRLVVEYSMAEADAAAADEISRRSHALIELLKQRPAAGAGVFLELRMVEASLIEFQASAREFAGQRDEARIALNTLVGRAPDAPINAVRVSEPEWALPSSEEQLKRLTQHPRWLMAQVAVDRMMAEAEASRLEAKSDYAVGPFVSHEDAGEQELALGVSFSMPLPWRNRNQGAIAAAEARERQAVAEKEAADREMKAELAQSVAAFNRANEHLMAVPESKILEVHDAADLAERQYRLGTVSVQLFLDMQREYLNVQLLRRQALRNAWNSALDLQQLMGISQQSSLSPRSGEKP